MALLNALFSIGACPLRINVLQPSSIIVNREASERPHQRRTMHIASPLVNWDAMTLASGIPAKKANPDARRVSNEMVTPWFRQARRAKEDSRKNTLCANARRFRSLLPAL